MELPQYSIKTLPAHYRALLNPRRAVPTDVNFIPSLPDASARFFVLVVSAPLGLTWLYVAYSQVFTSRHPGTMLGTMFLCSRAWLLWRGLDLRLQRFS